MSDPLPEPPLAARLASAELAAAIAAAIRAQGGWIPFSAFMRLALSHPQLGYYTGGASKLGRAGDFVTAPELSDLFGQAIANQLREGMDRCGAVITEFGAGSGQLALTILAQLDRLGALPERYQILDVSGDLRARQATLLGAAPAHLRTRVAWLDELPHQIRGVVIANEVLDAMPAEIVTKAASGWMMRGVSCDDVNAFTFADRPADACLEEAIHARIVNPEQLEEGYVTELNESATAFVATLVEHLEKAIVLFIDYGFPAREYYHPERNSGTVMAHYRHHAHNDLLRWPGLQDITTHVDFTAVATVATELGASLLGYTNQAHFLINCGIAELLGSGPEHPEEWLVSTNALKRLLSEAEMGELFKVMALGKGIGDPLLSLLGFESGERSAQL